MQHVHDLEVYYSCCVFILYNVILISLKKLCFEGLNVDLSFTPKKNLPPSQNYLVNTELFSYAIT